MALKPRAQIEVVDPSTVKLQGYAAITGNEFEYFDPFEWKKRRMMIDPGAFASVLARQAGQQMPVYWSHNVWSLQLGEASELHEDDRGLYFEGIPFATDETIDILTVMDGRARTGASMLFDFGEIAEDDDGVEHMLSFSAIYEVGPCPEGANPEAYAELVERAADEGAAAEPEPAAAPAIDSNPEVALAAAIHRATARLRRF